MLDGFQKIIKQNLSTIIILGILGIVILGFLGFSNIKAQKEQKKLESEQKAIHSGIEVWFKTKVQDKYPFISKFECEKSSTICSSIKFYANEEYDSYSVLDREDIIFSIHSDFGSIRNHIASNIGKSLLKLNSILENTVLVTEKGEYKYFKSEFTDIDGKVYTGDDIGKLRGVKQIPKITEGMLADEVISILGEPDEILNTSKDSYRWFFKGNGYIYFSKNKVNQILFKS